MVVKTKHEPKEREPTSQRAQRLTVMPEESMRRMEAFQEREEKFIASNRKSKDRNLPA